MAEEGSFVIERALDAEAMSDGIGVREAEPERAEPERAEPQPPRQEQAARRTRAHLAPWQVRVAKEMMMNQLAHRLVLEDVAARLNISVNHFIKAFSHTEGVAPYHWFMQRRIAHAMILLREQRLPISKIAGECGFADQSHFTKAFRRHVGTPPGRWRGTDDALDFRGEDAPARGK